MQTRTCWAVKWSHTSTLYYSERSGRHTSSQNVNNKCVFRELISFCLSSLICPISAEASIVLYVYDYRCARPLCSCFHWTFSQQPRLSWQGWLKTSPPHTFWSMLSAGWRNRSVIAHGNTVFSSLLACELPLPAGGSTSSALTHTLHSNRGVVEPVNRFLWPPRTEPESPSEELPAVEFVRSWRRHISSLAGGVGTYLECDHREFAAGREIITIIIIPWFMYHLW